MKPTNPVEPKRKKRRLLDKYDIPENFRGIIYLFIDKLIDELPGFVCEYLKTAFSKEKVKKLHQKILKARRRNKKCPKNPHSK